MPVVPALVLKAEDSRPAQTIACIPAPNSMKGPDVPMGSWNSRETSAEMSENDLISHSSALIFEPRHNPAHLCRAEWSMRRLRRACPDGAEAAQKSQRIFMLFDVLLDN